MIRLIQNTLVVVLSLVLSLLVAEGILRMTSIGDILVAETGNQYKFYEFDKRLGWRNGTGRFGQYTRGEFSYSIRINSHGMRYREVAREKPTNITRIAVLGDSFVWGIGVSDQERFTEMVEKWSAGKYELLNFGVSGYGPIQHYLMFDEIVSRFHPDIVLISFCLGNDFADNVFWRRYGYYKPFIQDLENREVVVAGYPLPRTGEFKSGPMSYWFADHSRVYALVMSSAKRASAVFNDHGQAGLIGANEDQKDIYFPESSLESHGYVDRMVAINAKLLAQIGDKARAHHVRLAVVVAPTKCEYGGCFPGEASRNMKAREQLTTTLKALDIPVIDQTDAIDMADFWKTDGHWRPSGHSKLADGILKWLDAVVVP